MKVKDIVDGKKRYDELSGLIKNIENAIEGLEVVKEEPKKNTLSSITFSSGMTGLRYYGDQDKDEKTKHDVSLNSDVSWAIKDDVEDILKRKLAELKSKQDALEVN